MSIYLHDYAPVLHAFVGVIDIATADYGVWSHPESRLWRILLEIVDHLKVHNCFPDSHTSDGNKKIILRPLFCTAEKLMDFLDSLPRFKWSCNHSLTPDKVEVTDHPLRPSSYWIKMLVNQNRRDLVSSGAQPLWISTGKLPESGTLMGLVGL